MPKRKLRGPIGVMSFTSIAPEKPRTMSWQNGCFHEFLYRVIPLMLREETKGRFRKRAVLANVPSFRFFVPGNICMYPRSGFWYRGTSEYTLLPVCGTGEHPPKPPFWKPPFCEPPNVCGGMCPERPLKRDI